MLSERYEHIECRKSEGAHYTPEELSNFVADHIVSRINVSQEKIKLVDPAIGDGELVISLIKKIKENSNAEIEVHGFDINERSLDKAKDRITSIFPEVTLVLHHEDFLHTCLTDYADDHSGLFTYDDDALFDALISNPPYIRTQVLGSEDAQILSSNFGLKGRIDIYQAFLVAMRNLLKPTAIAGVIVSNRFMTTKGAGKFREILLDKYNIHNIWDFGDTRLFEAAVLPAVMILSPFDGERVDTKFISIYEFTFKDKEDNRDVNFANNVVESLNYKGLVRQPNHKTYEVKHGRLDFDAKTSDLWRLLDDESEKWLKNIKSKTWATFKEIGKIRVGVKTTADTVFIKKSWSNEVGYKPELLRPITTHHVAGRYRSASQPNREILYTHYSENGKKVVYDIEKYPLSKRYLEEHRTQLEKREYVIKAKRNWYEIWVPQNPELWSLPKIVFRDISETPNFWIDTDKSIVNGDCYWMILENKNYSEDIIWLATAVANSKFIENFYDIKFQNKLYANRRRFITQYVEQFPIPNPESEESIKIVELAKARFKEQDEAKAEEIEKDIDILVFSAFN